MWCLLDTACRGSLLGLSVESQLWRSLNTELQHVVFRGYAWQCSKMINSSEGAVLPIVLCLRCGCMVYMDWRSQLARLQMCHVQVVLPSSVSLWCLVTFPFCLVIVLMDSLVMRIRGENSWRRGTLSIPHSSHSDNQPTYMYNADISPPQCGKGYIPLNKVKSGKVNGRWPSKHETLTQWWLNVGPASQTVAQH